MSEQKDYSKLTFEELVKEEKKIKKNEITSAVIIGCLIGVIIYGIAQKGFGFLYMSISLLLIYGIIKNSQKLKHNLTQIQAEMNARNME